MDGHEVRSPTSLEGGDEKKKDDATGGAGSDEAGDVRCGGQDQTPEVAESEREVPGLGLRVDRFLEHALVPGSPRHGSALPCSTGISEDDADGAEGDSHADTAPRKQWKLRNSAADAALGDPWLCVRLAMGSLAGESHRVTRALSCAKDAYELMPLPSGMTWHDLHQQSQSFEDFKAAAPFRPLSTNGLIDVVVYGDQQQLLNAVQLDHTLELLTCFLGAEAVLRPREERLGPWVQRRARPGESSQVSAQAIFAHLSASADPRSMCTIGLAAADLYPPSGCEFVTGLADAASRVGLFSPARYRVVAETRGSGAARIAASRCFAKTLAREILKMCGMRECRLLRCLLNPFPGTQPEAVDTLPLNLCCICLRKLQWLSQKDPLDRLKQLPPVLSDWYPEEVPWLRDRMRQLGMPTYTSAVHRHGGRACMWDKLLPRIT